MRRWICRGTKRVEIAWNTSNGISGGSGPYDVAERGRREAATSASKDLSEDGRSGRLRRVASGGSRAGVEGAISAKEILMKHSSG